MRVQKLRKTILHALCYKAEDSLFHKAKIPMRLVAKVKKEFILSSNKTNVESIVKVPTQSFKAQRNFNLETKELSKKALDAILENEVKLII